jgi:hypothetical protein
MPNTPIEGVEVVGVEDLREAIKRIFTSEAE